MAKRNSKTTVREHERKRPQRQEREAPAHEQLRDAFRRENDKTQEGFREWAPEGGKR
jgi:hypothetical protein